MPISLEIDNSQTPVNIELLIEQGFGILAGEGDMMASTYDPTSIEGDAFARANHTGAQAISTVTGLQTELNTKTSKDIGAPTNGDAQHITITGTLNDNNAKRLGFPKLYEASSDEWTWDGKPTNDLGYEAVVFYDATRWAAEVRLAGVVFARWQATVGAEASPHLATWTSSAVAPATGTPVFALVAAVPKTPVAAYFRDDAGRLWYPTGTSPDHEWVISTPRTDEFIDDFSIYADGTALGLNFQPMLGKPYLFEQGTGGGSGVPTVNSGKLGEAVPGDPAEVWYLGQELTEDVYQFGAVCEWEHLTALTGDIDQTMAFLIMPQYQWLNQLIHIRITTRLVIIDFATAGGVSGFIAVPLVGAEPAPSRPFRIPFGEKFMVRVRIEGDTLEIAVNGEVHKIVDPRIAQVNGRFIFFEQIGETSQNRIRYHRVWANAPSMDRITSAPWSPQIAQLVEGYSRKPLRIGLGNTNGLGRAPAGNGLLPLLDPVSSAAPATDEILWTRNIPGHSLTPLGSRWIIKANGRFGATNEDKTVRFDMAAGGPTTGIITQNGGTWDMEIVISASTSASHLCYGRITRSDGTVHTARWSFNNGVGTTFTLRIRATGVTAADVIIDHAFGDWIGANP